MAADRGHLLVNPVIYAELAAGYPTIESAEQALIAFGTRLEELPREALYLAGAPHEARQPSHSRDGGRRR